MDKFHLAASVSASCYYRTEPLIIKQIVCFSFRVQSNVCRVHTYITKVYFMESCLFFCIYRISVVSTCFPNKIPAQYVEREHPLNEARVWLIIYPLPPSVACPLHSHHHVSLLTPTPQPFIPPPSPSHSQSAPFGPPSPLSTLFIMYTLHVVHISSHYTSEKLSLPRVSDEYIGKLYMHTDTSWPGSVRSFCKFIWEKHYDRAAFRRCNYGNICAFTLKNLAWC